MSARPYKLGVLGDWQSGRSSVVAVLSGKPCPNHPGIQVTRWTEPASGIMFDVWDVNSRTALESLGQVFISDCDALIAVADATRPGSVQIAGHALRAALDLLGPRPAALLLNKSDLPAAVSQAEPPPGAWLASVSARTGAGVIEVFARLAQQLKAAAANRGERSAPV